MSDNPVLLEISGLRVEGKSEKVWHPILKGIDLRLDRGEVLGLVGESGAGKSTLGLAAIGYFRPDCRPCGGSVRLDGKELLSCSEQERSALWGRRVAYVAQSAAVTFNPAHRLQEQVIEPILIHGLDPRETALESARTMFARLRLPDPEKFGERFPHQVSGGQLQRAMTAMALVARPDLIIFDEPTTALDVTTQVEVLAAIRDAVRISKTAAIYITHDLAVVAQVADRIKVLRHGETVEEQPTRQIMSQPAADYTRTLWSVRTIHKEGRAGDAPLLAVENVDTHYGAVKALDRVSFSVPKARTVAIVGESGSGKSTIARVICGLQARDAGDVHFMDQSLPARIEARSPDFLRRLQMVHQMADTAMNPRQRIRDILGRPLEHFFKMKGEARDRRIVELLEMIELDKRFMNRLPSELSGGQKQRVCIARALAAKPDLIICDEVTSALDQVVQRNILQLLQKLQDDLQVSFMFITHDLHTVQAIADEVVVMNRGRVIDAGPKAEVLKPPFVDYTGKLMASVPQMDPDWLTNVLADRTGQLNGVRND
jgi:peptide/nickel transport system ATP-binding protein